MGDPGTPVPADDMPDNIVPADDLPGAPAPAQPSNFSDFWDKLGHSAKDAWEGMTGDQISARARAAILQKQPDLASQLSPAQAPEAPATTTGGKIGSALGSFLAPQAVPGAAAKVAATAADTYAQHVALLQKAGVPLDAAQISPASKLAATGKAIVQDAPLVGMQGYAEGQAGAFTRAALRTIGADGTEATPAVMAKAKKGITSVLDRVEDNTTLDLNNGSALTRLAQTEADATSTLEAGQAKLIKGRIDSILDAASKNGGKLGGEQWQVQKRVVDALADSGNPDIARFGVRLKDDMQRAMLDSVADPAEKAAYSEALTKYRRMKQIEAGIDKGNVITPNALYSGIDKLKNANQTVYGRGDTALSDLAQAGSNVLGRSMPNSGTFRRAAAASMAIGSGAAAYEVAQGNYADAFKAALVGFVGPTAARALITNPQAAAKVAQAMKAAGRYTGPVLAAETATPN